MHVNTTLITHTHTHSSTHTHTQTYTQACAIKVESCISSKQVLKMEVAVLRRLQGATPQVCEFLGCGRNEKVNYIIMTLLGPSLSELRKRQPQQRFSISTTLRIGIQIVSAVHAMHECGFLHRDIKPSNFAIGGSTKFSRVCYMLDFGLSRQYITPTGEMRQPRPVAGFRGTVRYASLNAHRSKDLGRHDDLWSVLYMLVELATGQLPWRKIRDKEEAGKLKAMCDHRKLIWGLPTEFQDFLEHLQSLTYFLRPNYGLVTNLLATAVKRLGAHGSDPFDWEQDYSAPSVNTASIGSPPALRAEEKGDRDDPQGEAPANQQKAHASSGSKTDCTEVVSLNENYDREQLQLPAGVIDNDKALEQAHHSEKEPLPKSSESETSTSSATTTSSTTTTSSSSHKKHNDADKSLKNVVINGEDFRRSELDGLVNQYLTEDGKDNVGVSVPSHGHPQPFQLEERVRVLPAYEHNISNQMQGHSSFTRLKNGSLADRNGLTDSLDRFFELQPKQSQEDEEEGHQRDDSEKSKEPKPNFSEKSPSDLKPLSLTQEISSKTNAGVVQVAPSSNPNNAPQLAYGSENALSSGEHHTVELSLNAAPEKNQIMQQHALKACTSEDSSTSALSPLAPKVDIPQSCSLPEPSSKLPLTQVQPSVAKLLTPVPEQQVDRHVEKALPSLPCADTHPVKSTRGKGVPLSEVGARKCSKPLTLELLPTPPLSEPQIQVSTTVHSNPVTPTVINTSALISNQRRRSLHAKFPDMNITSGLPAVAAQRHSPMLSPLNHVPHPPNKPPPPNYASCVSARRRRFSRTPTSGDHLPKFTDQSPI